MDDARPFATDASVNRPRLLIVDHNRTNLGVMARRLSEAGFRVATADSAAAAIGEMHRAKVDLLLAELYMPKMSGADLAGWIRGEIALRDLPVMLITGRSEPNGAVRAYEAGADDVVLKPFHFEVLIARIERRLERAQAIQALRDDMAALDARVVSRAIELGELRERWLASEAERRRLADGIRTAA